MKIGEISEKYGVSIQTLRFYIKRELLIPKRRGYQYNFTEKDEKELDFILQCKKMHFTLDETLQLLSTRRVSQPGARREEERYLAACIEKRKELFGQRHDLNIALEYLSEEIEQVQNGLSEQVPVHGVELSFLNLLRCPRCGSQFRLTDSVIENAQILSADLTCPCGMRYRIRNGVVYEDGDLPTLSDNSFFNASSLFIDEYDPGTISATKMDEQRLLSTLLKTQSAAGSVLLETNFKQWFFLLTNMDALDYSNQYILADQYPEVIEYYKPVFERSILRSDPHPACLFIACRPENLPLRKPCLDCWIDNMDTVEHSETRQDFLPELLKPYIKDKASIMGFTREIADPDFFSKLRRLHQDLPEGLDRYYAPGRFRDLLTSLGFKVTEYSFLRNRLRYSSSNGLLDSANMSRKFFYAAVKETD